ncbi:uncharacterized protein [Typha angustifolia]|uniref:uncharacterized protein n=1 Tax=Typha angustifolia TaxID=59011 RepID=UPI003C2C9D72
MANGDKPSDPEAFVLRSGVRAGLKREFAFALKAQAELPAFLGRTRSRKPVLTGNPTAFSAVPVASIRDTKRAKKSDGGDGPPEESVYVLAPLPPSTPSPIEADAPNMVEGKDESIGDSDLRENELKAISEVSEAMPEMEEDALPPLPPSAIDTPMVVDDKTVTSLVDCPVEDGDTKENPIVLETEKPLHVGLQESPVGNLPSPPVEILDREQMASIPTEKPMRRFTRSVLKIPSKDQEGVAVEKHVSENGHCVPLDEVGVVSGNSTRRFTRSLIKGKTEDSGVGSEATTSNGSVRSEEMKDGASESVSSGVNKKMEMKMSKKVAPTKSPSNVRELLATGLLEGFPVKYFVPNGKLPTLHGVIKGNNILCSCASCNGSRAVSAYNFELHAGSTKKHPSDYIYLDNGNSLRDVLITCTDTSLDMLEAAIQNAIGPMPTQRPFACQNCSEIFLSSCTGKLALLCDSCLYLKLPKKTLTPSHASAISTRLSRAGSPPSAPDSLSKNASSGKKSTSIGRLTRKDVGLHKLVFMNDILPEGTEVGYYVGGKRLLSGYIKDSGIYCHCCNSVVSPSQFEAHAGRASRRKPYNNIYTSNGVSLHELSVSLSKDRKMSASENDDLCSICADGGDLLLCDLCPRAFHKECVGLSIIPKGEWYCQYCHNLHQREKCLAHNNNAIAAGRVAGVDPIEQIFKRCIRIVTTSETDLGGCALCKLHDFSRSRFDARTVLLCDQCEKEYHVGCLKDHNMADLKELPEGEWFCSADCSRIHTTLQDLLLRSTEPLPDFDVDVIKKKRNEKCLNTDTSIDMRWRLLSGRNASADSKLLLSKAVAIFHESFDPIVEATTGRDLIPSMVYGRTVRDQDYSGMYCAVLTDGSSVVSAGLLRVMGSEAAELPLVATSRESQGQGYFQSLFSCIERLLVSLKVKHFVLPAADEAESIWTKKFGFTKITSDQLEEYLNGARTTIFQGTSTLHKPVALS